MKASIPSLSRHQQAAIACALLPVFAIWQLNGLYLAVFARESAFLFWLADFAQWVLLPSALLGWLASRAALRPSAYGLGLRGWKLTSLTARTLLVFLSAGLTFLVVQRVGARLLGNPAAYLQYPALSSEIVAGTVGRIYMALTASLVESIFFLGLPWLYHAHAGGRPSPAAFTLVVSAIFALAHWEHGAHVLLAAFFCHIVFCAWYLEWKTLWPIAGGHACIDLAVFA